ncbi:hypothetical protein Poly24_32490 [Rosistilla carotiformis]|uniref:Sulfotransferase family protein n=1 Tax=Rosistilla carotiformis TaxID=2528017 RepID=A0A518JVG2_9BACT|nr:sulfotransferase family 2 domain-containing protein [Rosistilla carotiformis]QDV69533.1 hypothetical protein Poly24_32490 [Rosistilla carotiformis]
MLGIITTHFPIPHFTKLGLPEDTFAISCFRDPVKRVISHYNMLLNYRANNVNHPCMLTEGQWLGASFDDFLTAIPDEHLLNQLYMFSADLDVAEAVERVAGLSHFLFTEDFDRGVKQLNKKTGFPICVMHRRSAKYLAVISDDSMIRLREKLESEYIFLDHVRKLKNVAGDA